jgi:hypothetical protein
MHNRQAQTLLNDRQGALPVWIRPPKFGNDYYCGLSRSKLYQLAKDGKVHSVSIREPGKIKGTRLFELASVLEFIEAQAN